MAPSSDSKHRGFGRTWFHAALAALIVAGGLALPAGQVTAQTGGIDRSVIPIAPTAPERYVVVKGDTLWDISAKFLTDPWYWPEIWYVNPQVENPHLIYPGDVLALTWVDGRPRLVLERGGAVRMSPRVREHPLSEAIHAIPWEVVEAFMSKPTVLAKEQVENAPYVVASSDRRIIAAIGDDVFARRLEKARAAQSFLIYRVDAKLKDPDDGDVLGYQGIYSGTGEVTQAGDPTTLRLIRSTRETMDGDILLPDTIDLGMDFIPRPPSRDIEGTIMAVVDGHLAFGEYQVVVINRGSRHGLEPGNVLSVWEHGKEIKDETKYRESRKVTLPDQRTGEFMVFKTWDRMSYGLLLDSTREMHVGDAVRNP